MSAAGSQWIGVPGELRGYEALHRRYGKLSWAKLFEPTIKLARDGIKVPPFLSELLKEPRMKAQVEHTSLWYGVFGKKVLEQKAFNKTHLCNFELAINGDFPGGSRGFCWPCEVAP